MPKKKAPNGSGTIRLRKDGKTWEARYSARDPITGQSVQKSVYALSQEECAKKLRKATAEIDEGTYQEPSRLTVSKWADIWMAEYWGGLKESTQDQYGMHIRLNIKPGIGPIKLQALAAHNIQAMYNALQRGTNDGRTLSPKSIHNLNGVVHSMLAQAQKLGYIRSNPAEGVTLPRVEKKEMQALQDAKLDDFLAAIKRHKYEAVYLVDVFTGLRQAEILGLTWKDVDFDRGVIHVRKQLQKERKRGGVYKRVNLKNDKVRRIKPAPFVMDVLKDVQRKQKERRLRAGAVWCNTLGLVFTDDLGGNLSTKSVYNNFKALVAGIGMESIRMHDLRHTFAMLSLQMGVDIKTLQQELGHATAAFTLDVYGHVNEAMLSAASEAVQRHINDWKARQ